MKKRKTYHKTRFATEVIQSAYNVFISKTGMKGEKTRPRFLWVSYGNETWDYDSIDEFLAEYPKAERYAFEKAVDNPWRMFDIHGNTDTVSIGIEFPKRVDIEAIFQVFEQNLERSSIAVASQPIKVFIGHGKDDQWRDLKDHLHEQHGFDVTAYEIGPRAGLSVKEVLESMLNESSFAFLVLTGEDVNTYGELHARENVVHEAGLFQGRIGFRRAILLLEAGVNEFSNIFGLNQIRFSKGNIRETFGDAVATIKRELMDEDT
jgi:predicted nucleotide-binding protein